MRFAWLFVAAILLVGLAGTAVALHSREQDSRFVARHEVLAPVGARQLERLLLTTSDPRPRYAGRARLVRCHFAAAATTPASALGNPWTCVVRYPGPPPVRFRVTVHADRSIFGAGQPEGSPHRNFLTVRGCCVAAGAGP
jgi:hypothetical protein